MPEQKKTSGKAVGVTGGGGVGLFLIKLASFITDPHGKTFTLLQYRWCLFF